MIYVFTEGGIVSDRLPYTETCSGEELAPALVNDIVSSDIVYGTCKITTGLSPEPLFMAAFSSATSAIGGITIDGNLGCDGKGVSAPPRHACLRFCTPIVHGSSWQSSPWSPLLAYTTRQ